MSKDEVWAMINAAIVDMVRYGDQVGVQSSGKTGNPPGMFLCAEEGGPTEEKSPFRLTSRASISLWEKWKLFRGN